MKSARNKKTFTLIEMLIVIVIIGILAAALVPRLQSVQGRARDTERRIDLTNINNGILMWQTDKGSFPATIVSLWQTGNFLSAYLTSMPEDPLGTGAGYMYFRKDYGAIGCMSVFDGTKYAMYAKMETASNATGSFVDSFDNCVRTTWTMNHRTGNQ